MEIFILVGLGAAVAVWLLRSRLGYQDGSSSTWQAGIGGGSDDGHAGDGWGGDGGGGGGDGGDGGGD